MTIDWEFGTSHAVCVVKVDLNGLASVGLLFYSRDHRIEQAERMCGRKGQWKVERSWRNRRGMWEMAVEM